MCSVHHCASHKDRPTICLLSLACSSPPLQVPAWPFVIGSFAFGIFALAPYFALWEPPKEKPQAPPAKADLVRLLQACTALMLVTSCHKPAQRRCRSPGAPLQGGHICKPQTLLAGTAFHKAPACLLAAAVLGPDKAPKCVIELLKYCVWCETSASMQGVWQAVAIKLFYLLACAEQHALHCDPCGVCRRAGAAWE